MVRGLTDKEIQRFHKRYMINPETQCWEWRGATNNGGYGRFWLDGKLVNAHRLAYTTFVGPIPVGLQIDHLCRVRNCVNPAHLEPVTGKENTLRGESPSAVHARKTHCIRGHPYDAENTFITKAGARLCRACHKRRGLISSRKARGAVPRDEWRALRGSAHKMAKLTEDIVREVRRAYRSGVPIRQLAQTYGVTKSGMEHAVKGITWKHVPMVE